MECRSGHQVIAQMVSALDDIVQLHAGMAEAKKRNIAIEQEIVGLTGRSVELSNGYIETVAKRLADPAQKDAVTTLERLVIMGANLNSTNNLTTKGLFYRAAFDYSTKDDLLTYVQKGIEQASLDVERLANTPFAQLPVEALKANRQVLSVANEFISNVDTVNRSYDQIDETISGLLTEMQQISQSSQIALASKINHAFLMIAGILIAAVLLAGIFSAIGIRSINNTINTVVLSLTRSSDQISSSSQQVACASQSLAEGATEQAAGLEETSSSLEEMSSMTRQNADNAQQANALAADSCKTANNGTQAMQSMNEAIQEIQTSSDETAKIIKVIDEIAFQTNLLALNAAVEAARAGEAGKGFAVVAEEVRKLAMRSAEAAKNTSTMIEESVKNAKNGVDIAGQVGKVLQEIVEGVGKTTDLVKEIAAASQEQAQGIDQVNTAVAQMDKVTQQNAASAEESASASEELSAQAKSMNQAVQELVALVGSQHVDNRSTNRENSQPTKRASKAPSSPATHSAFHKIAQPA